MKYKSHALDHQYEHTNDPMLRHPHVVRPGQPGKAVQAYLYTDGASKGYHNSPDKRSFSGWGYVLHSTSLAKEYTSSAFGGMTNASSVEAEFFSALKGLSAVRFPADLRLITDCAELIGCFADIDGALSRHRAIRSKPPSERLPRERYESKYLNIFSKIARELNQRANIRSMSVEWVRAHTLDDFAVMPNPDDLQGSEDRRRLRLCLGNHAADAQAQRGVHQAIRSALWFLAHPGNHESPTQHLLTCRKNFAQSWFARDAAVKFLSSRPGYLTRDILEAVMPETEAGVVLAAWTEEHKPSEPARRNPFSEVASGERQTAEAGDWLAP